jgi:hypothetical protein
MNTLDIIGNDAYVYCTLSDALARQYYKILVLYDVRMFALVQSKAAYARIKASLTYWYEVGLRIDVDVLDDNLLRPNDEYAKVWRDIPFRRTRSSKRKMYSART